MNTMYDLTVKHTKFSISHLQAESPNESRLNRLGVHLLTSLLLVFGTLVEFSVILIAKQRSDWNKQPCDANDNNCESKSKLAWISNNHTTVPDCTRELQKTNENAEKEMKNQFLELNPILNHITSSKNIPSYRKVDIIAFILFTGFYLCFNLIYFYVCINHQYFRAISTSTIKSVPTNFKMYWSF